MKLGLISDTHNRMHPGVLKAFEGVDAIFHAGDVGNEDIITTLETLAPVYAVYGNTDYSPVSDRNPEWRLEEIGGKRIFMTHIQLRQDAKSVRETLSRFGVSSPPDVFIFGHSHRDFCQRVDGVLMLNPGSAGPPRFELKPSVMILEILPDGKMLPALRKLM